MPALAQSRSALVAPVSGSDALLPTLGKQCASAVNDALKTHAYVPNTDIKLGKTLMTCETPACTEQTLRSAQATIGIVVAVWNRQPGQAPQMTLTLIDHTARNINAEGLVTGDVKEIADALVDQVLDKWREQTTPTTPTLPPPPPRTPKKKKAWLAGPITLIVAGAGALGAVGVAAATTTSDERLKASSAAIWGSVGAAAIGAGVVWWVVNKRKHSTTRTQLTPLGIAVRHDF